MPYHRCTACGLTGYAATAHTRASACPNCSAKLAGSPKVTVVPGAMRELDRTLLARPQAVAEARHALVALPLPQTTRETLALLVSELVTNAVRHGGVSTGGLVDLNVRSSTGRVRLEVRDGGQGFQASQSREVDPLSVGGQGLLIVAALSDAWGVQRDLAGCTVWCELAFTQDVAAQLRVKPGHVVQTGPEPQPPTLGYVYADAFDAHRTPDA